MGRRLPEGEAARRAAERRRRVWAGETKHTYNPVKEGYGNAAEWRRIAEDFLGGHTILKATPRSQLAADLEFFGFSEMPTAKALTVAYHQKVRELFAAFGSDTAPGYAETFGEITTIRDRIKAK